MLVRDDDLARLATGLPACMSVRYRSRYRSKSQLRRLARFPIDLAML
jgi:hypothetical protein